MEKRPRSRPRSLGQAEQLVMDYLWTHASITSEECRAGLASSWPMKDSTIRTVLRRLEVKGYVEHELRGRTFLYRAREARAGVAARAVRNIIDRFCGGSAEELVMGLVENQVIQPRELERLVRRVAERRGRS